MLNLTLQYTYNCTVFKRLMARTKRLELKLSQQEYDRLKAASDAKDISMAELLRDFIKTLPST